MKHFGRVIGLATELGLRLGLTAAGLVVLGLIVGRWLDARLGTAPWATLVGILLGAVSGQVALYRLVTNAIERFVASPREVSAEESAPLGKGFALQVLVALFLLGPAGFGLGLWLDQLLGTKPVLTLLLALGGIGIGLILALAGLLSKSVPGPRG